MRGTKREYAKHRRQAGFTGCTTQAINQAIKAARLPEPLFQGAICLDFEAADAAWLANTLPTLAAPSPRPPAAPASALGPLPDYHESRARREAAEAALAELELATKRRDLVPYDDGVRVTEAAMHLIRATFGADVEGRAIEMNSRWGVPIRDAREFARAHDRACFEHVSVVLIAEVGL